MGRRCDCENSTCHPKADCVAEGTVKTIHSTVCDECAAKMPAEYLASTTKCAFCPNPAEFNWSDADGNESKPVCQNCLDASDRPRWQFTPINTIPATELRLSGQLSHRELATILHGLRMIQCQGRIEGCLAGDCEHFEDTEALSDAEIDTLCERINLQRVENLVDAALAKNKTKVRS